MTRPLTVQSCDVVAVAQLTHSWGGGNSLTQTLIEKKIVTSVIIIVMRDLRVFLIRQVEQGFLSKLLKDFDDFSKSGVGCWWRRTVKLWKKIIPCSHLLLKIAKKTINFFHCLPKKKHLNSSCSRNLKHFGNPKMVEKNARTVLKIQSLF